MSMPMHMYNAVKVAYKRLDAEKPKPVIKKESTLSMMGKPKSMEETMDDKDKVVHYMQEIRRIRGEV